jgi:hypothetical protein
MIEHMFDDVRRFSREASQILVRRVPDEGPAIQQGWASFEDLVGLRGRKFYGLIDDAAGEYLLCTAIREDDPPDHFGLEVGELPGGDYLRLVLQGQPPALYEQIAPAARHLQELAEPDGQRYGVEYYRRHDVVEVWMPVR